MNSLVFVFHITIARLSGRQNLPSPTLTPYSTTVPVTCSITGTFTRTHLITRVTLASTSVTPSLIFPLTNGTSKLNWPNHSPQPVPLALTSCSRSISPLSSPFSPVSSTVRFVAVFGQMSVWLTFPTSSFTSIILLWYT